MEINVNIKASELATAISKLAEALLSPRGFTLVWRPPATDPEPAVPEEQIEMPLTQSPAPEPAPVEVKAPTPTEPIALVNVREALTKLPSDTARAIIKSFEVKKLTDLAPENYPAIMAKIKEAS